MEMHRRNGRCDGCSYIPFLFYLVGFSFFSFFLSCFVFLLHWRSNRRPEYDRQVFYPWVMSIVVIVLYRDRVSPCSPGWHHTPKYYNNRHLPPCLDSLLHYAFSYNFFRNYPEKNSSMGASALFFFLHVKQLQISKYDIEQLKQPVEKYYVSN